MNTINIPGFSAEATLYRTRNRYRLSISALSTSVTAQSVVPALNSEDRARCDRCENKCNNAAAECLGYATGSWSAALAGCAAFGPFAPACAIPATAIYLSACGVCYAKLALCYVVGCNLPGDSSCCPEFCELGHCCSRGETCCGDMCCAPGQTCCGGNKCCPAGWHCTDGFCSDSVPFSNEPPPTPPPYNPLTDLDPISPVFCYGKICRRGEKCCGPQGCGAVCVN